MNRVSKSVIIGDDDYTYDKDGVNDFAKILVGTILSRHVHYANLRPCFMHWCSYSFDSLDNAVQLQVFLGSYTDLGC